MAHSDKELELFNRFIGSRLADGTASSIDEAYSQWKEQADLLLSIQRSLEDVEAGRTKPWTDFVREFREKNDIQEG